MLHDEHVCLLCSCLLPLRVCQDYAAHLYNRCLEVLREAVPRNKAADQKIDEAVTGGARKAAIDSIVDKQMKETRNHIRVVNNSSYHFVQWDSAHTQSEEEEKAWATA